MDHSYSKLRNIALSTNSELSFFSYEILGLVGRGGAGPHDLLRMAKEGRMLNWAGESQYYTEPKRLAKVGYLAARKEPGKTRERTVYELTDKGLEALHEYARTAVTFMPLKSDALLRLLLCDLVGEDVTRESLATLRDDIADIEARLDDAERRAHELPHREKYLLLVIGFLRRLLDLHEDLVEQVERELSGEPRRGEGHAERAAPDDDAVTRGVEA
jgi:DNA-binding PadR family transcriptional regulator